MSFHLSVARNQNGGLARTAGAGLHRERYVDTATRFMDQWGLMNPMYSLGFSRLWSLKFERRRGPAHVGYIPRLHAPYRASTTPKLVTSRIAYQSLHKSATFSMSARVYKERRIYLSFYSSISIMYIDTLERSGGIQKPY